MQNYLIISLAFAGGLFVGMFLNQFAVGPWLRALMSGGKISLFDVVGMRFRGSPVNLVIDAYQALVQAGESVTLGRVESLYIVNRNRVHNADDLVSVVRNHTEDQGN